MLENPSVKPGTPLFLGGRRHAPPRTTTKSGAFPSTTVASPGRCECAKASRQVFRVLSSFAEPEAFRKAFKNFDPELIARFRKADVARLTPASFDLKPRSRPQLAAFVLIF